MLKAAAPAALALTLALVVHPKCHSRLKCSFLGLAIRVPVFFFYSPAFDFPQAPRTTWLPGNAGLSGPAKVQP